MGKSKTRVIVLPLLFLAVLTMVYLPALRGGFLLEDDACISRNAELTSAQALRAIWLKPVTIQQYAPLTLSAFWVEYHLWGLNPLGYHLVNVALHAFNAILLGLILQGLSLPGAWIAACLFALHPVQAESVAWMTELKNVLSTFFYLLTLLVLLRKIRERERGLPLSVLAAALFLCALLSESAAITLPVSYLIVTWWLAGSVNRKNVRDTVPLLGLGLGAGFFILHAGHPLVGAQGMPWHYSVGERLIIAGRAFWFYLGKLLYPASLSFIYPRWVIHAQDVVLYLFPAMALAFCGLLAYGKRWWGPLPFACLLFFVISLLPTLGFTSFSFMRYSFVADHCQYLGSLGIMTLAGWLLATALRALKVPETSAPGRAVIFMICVDLALMTCRATRKYAGSEALWQATVAANPMSAFAHHNLGIALSEQNKWREAVSHLRMAEALDPSFPQTHSALAFFAVRGRQWDYARQEYAEAIRLGIHDPRILQDYAALPPPASKPSAGQR